MKEQYLSAVQPAELALFLRARREDSLQALMATALDLEADMKRTKLQTRTNPGGTQQQQQPRYQNPDRKPCNTCGKWKLYYDACPNCGAAGQPKRAANKQAPPRKRASEVVVQEVNDEAWEEASTEGADALVAEEGNLEYGLVADEGDF